MPSCLNREFINENRKAKKTNFVLFVAHEKRRRLKHEQKKVFCSPLCWLLSLCLLFFSVCTFSDLINHKNLSYSYFIPICVALRGASPVPNERTEGKSNWNYHLSRLFLSLSGAGLCLWFNFLIWFTCESIKKERYSTWVMCVCWCVVATLSLRG